MKRRKVLEPVGSLARPGRRRQSPRRLALLGLLCLAVLAVSASGCKNKSAKRVPQPVMTNPPPAKPLVTDPLPPPMPPPKPKVVEAPPPDPEPSEAEQRFASGLYGEAAAAYEADLKSGALSSTPETLIRLAIAYQLGPQPESNRSRVVQLLEQALQAKPEGPLAGVAQSLLALLERNRTLLQDVAQKDRRIRQLSDELERLKQIDLRRRPPGW